MLKNLRADFSYYGQKMLRGIGWSILVVGGFALVIGFAALLACPTAWVLMLLIGILHSYIPAVPAYGFTLVYVIVWILSILRSLLFGNKNER